MKRSSVTIVVILIIAAVLRLWNIGGMPPGATNDEAGSIYSALSLWQTGRAIDGQLLPLSINLDNSWSPVGIYLGAPFVGIFGLSVPSWRVPFALLSVGTVLLMYFLVRELFKDYKYKFVRLSLNSFGVSFGIAEIAALLLAISPWHIHMNRGPYDGPITFFFLASLLALVKLVNGSVNLWFIPIFFLTFLTYHATKIFWLLFIPFVLFIQGKQLKNIQKQAGIIVLSVLIGILSFVFIAKTQTITRQNVLLTHDLAKIAKHIDWQREQSRAPMGIRKIMNNKLTYIARQSMRQYLGAFSPLLLFTDGEGGIYGTYEHGLLYLIELPFVLLGLWFLLHLHNRKAVLFVLGGLLIAPIPSAIASDQSYGLRSIGMLPFLMIIVACGIYQGFVWASKNKTKTVLHTYVIVVAGIYLVSIFSYLYLYHSRYSRYGAEWWFASHKDLISYMQSHRSEYDKAIITNAGDMFVFQWGLYNNLPVEKIAKSWGVELWPKTIDELTLVTNCPQTPVPQTYPERTWYITPDSCHPQGTPSARILDRAEPLRTVWKIFAY